VSIPARSIRHVSAIPPVEAQFEELVSGGSQETVSGFLPGISSRSGNTLIPLSFCSHNRNTHMSRAASEWVVNISPTTKMSLRVAKRQLPQVKQDKTRTSRRMNALKIVFMSAARFECTSDHLGLRDVVNQTDFRSPMFNN
jgi:hypothetical protein